MEPTTSHAATESGLALMTKAAAPVSVSVASLAGMPVSDLVLWATLIYTALMIGHKLYSIYQDVRGRGDKEN